MPVLEKTKAHPFRRNHLLRDAIGTAIHEGMAMDPAIHLFGEGAAVKVHYDAPAIERAFSNRVHTMPISEDGNVNFAVGAALIGLKPVVDIISADFLYRAMDSIANTAAKLDFVTRREHTIVIRAEFLAGGPTTGQRPEAMFAHVPGLRVVVPSTPRDAYGLMRTALTSPGVTLFFEDRMIDDEFDPEDMEYGQPIPIGKALYRRYGQRGTAAIITYGVMRQRLEQMLAPWGKGDPHREPNIDCGLVDLRSIYPIDFDTIRYAVLRHCQAIIVEPDVRHGGVGAEIAAWLAENMTGMPVRRVGVRRETLPAASALHYRALPTEEEIVSAIRSLTDWSSVSTVR
jgi:acetoin:2,6-dichlorophenolindophenol oxidoreductase subunit beta